ncbi:MAG: type III pantothenate kinase [Gammaproteobacteria bacterium]
MKLLLDVGNTRLKWAWSSAEGLVRTGNALHRGKDFAAALNSALEEGALPDEVRVANVAGPAAGALIAEAVLARCGVSVVFARSRDAAYGLRNGYADPGQLGVDRWLAMSAAWRKFPGPLCVVDAGTAVTVDIVGADGRHSGGLIVPGAALMASALRQQTGDLDRAAGPEPGQEMLAMPVEDRHTFGRDTASGIRLGAVRALTALIADCLVRPGAADMEAKLIISGGDGAWLARLIGARAIYLPDLVLDGLAIDPVCYAVA